MQTETKRQKKEEKEKVEDVSRRQLSRISRNSYDLFLSITEFAAGTATHPSTKNRWIIVLNIEAVVHTYSCNMTQTCDPTEIHTMDLHDHRKSQSSN